MTLLHPFTDPLQPLSKRLHRQAPLFPNRDPSDEERAQDGGDFRDEVRLRYALRQSLIVGPFTQHILHLHGTG